MSGGKQSYFICLIFKLAPMSRTQEMSDKSKKLGAANDKPRVFSLRDLQDGENCHSSDDEKQIYYAGGEKSGTAVQGGGKKDSNNYKEAQDIMSKIFAKASSEDTSKNQNINIFSGSGKKLNGTSSPKAAAGRTIPEPEIVTVDLIFWNGGFTIGQGPLKSYDDPEGLRLLDSLRSGEISARDLGIGSYELADVKITQVPNEPFSSERRDQITKRTEPSEISAQYKPAFNGNGEKIGENNSEIITVNLDAELEPSVSSTRIQVVLPNGSRKVITISARAKVSELYYIVKKETNLSTFVLKSGNPARLIPEELDAFIYQIGLLNSSIILSN